MRRSTWLVIALVCGNAFAATVDMKNERRAVGTSDGVRIDAQLVSETVTPHVPIGVTYQIENLTAKTIAIADKFCDTTYDPESRTMTLAVGWEIPNDGTMPHIEVIPPGEKRTFKAGASFTGRAIPRYIQIRVNVLRDAAAFVAVSEHRQLDDAQFNRWIDSIESIDMNVIPVRYRPAITTHTSDASVR